MKRSVMLFGIIAGLVLVSGSVRFRILEFWIMLSNSSLEYLAALPLMGYMVLENLPLIKGEYHAPLQY